MREKISHCEAKPKQSSIKLETLKWQEFKIADLFEIYTGALINPNDLKEGQIPRITATENNNGIAFFTQNIENKNFRTLENFISVSFLGAAFYQKNKVSLDMKIHALKLKDKELNSYIALFLIPVIKNFTFKYMYGYQLSTRILKMQKILLPINSQNQPDFEFMESFMKDLESKHLQKILSYYQYKLHTNNGGGAISFNYQEYKLFNAQSQSFIEGGLMELAKEHLDLEKIEWGEFIIGEIFDINSTKNGIDKNKLNTQKGNYPYITRTDRQNGIDDFIVIQEKYTLNENNVISIGLDTQTAFYQNTNFYTGQNIQILKHKKLNKYNALFIIIALKKLMTKFNWGGNGATLTRLKRGKILLPQNTQNKPDFEFMENFMRELEYKKIYRILNFYQNKLNRL